VGTDFTNLKLFVDTNNDAAYDEGDTQVGGAGAMALFGQWGTITFSTEFGMTAAEDYILVSDWNAPERGSSLTINLPTSGIISDGDTQDFFGLVSSVTHIRSAGGGGSGSISNLGALGAGIEVGGDQIGGGGEELGGIPGFLAPTTNGTPHNEWTTGVNAYISDGLYASETVLAERQSYGTYGFSIPGTNTIDGIEVKLEASASTNAGTIEVALSWDGGTSISSMATTTTLTTTDTIYTLGTTADLWGHAWTPAEFSDGNFRLRVTGQSSGENTVQIDAIQVRVYHSATGGGGGGGGGEI
jgi:hypothetical protein